MKNYYFLKSLLFLAIINIVFSCAKQEDIITVDKNSTVINLESVSNRITFARALAKALKDEQVRAFIKSEALKKYDGDYDIVYALIKNNKLKNGKTFEEVLKQYANDDLRWTCEEPLMTIFVPDLKSFSANNWDVKEQIPDVVLDNSHIIKEEKFKAFSNKSQEYNVDVKVAPKYPVIVVKENERILAKSKKGVSAREKNSIEFVNSNKKIEENESYAFYFIGDVNPNEYYKRNAARQATYSQLPPHLTWHFGWAGLPAKEQRDYIYYYLLSANGYVVNGNSISEHPKYGVFSSEYYEHIKGFKLISNIALESVSDHWTEGLLEFHIHHSFIHRDGGLQTDLKVFFCNVSDLIDENGNMKEYDPNIELMGWDIYRYGDEWTFTVLEKDPGGSRETNVSVSSTYGTNFEANLGITEKIGLKFGTSSTFQKSASQKITITSESDELGSGRLLYDAPVIYQRGANNTYLTNATGTGAALLSIEPVQKFPDSRPTPE